MARVEIPAPADLIVDATGMVLSGRPVTLKLAGTATDVTHYSALTGGTSTTGGLVTSNDGTIVNGSGARRYIDSGAPVDITVAGQTRQLEPLSASVESSVPYTLAEAGVTFYADAASADAGTDATALINAAAAVAYAAGRKLVDGKGGFVKITDTVTFGDIDLDLSGTTLRVNFAYPLGAETPAVKVSQPGALYANRVSKRTIRLPKVQNADRGGVTARWITGGGTTSTSANDTAIRLVNCEGCDISVPEAQAFSLGLETVGESNAGFAYNTVRLGYLLHNRINHRLGQIDATGWCNSNTFIGGSYAHVDGEGGAITRLPGTRHISILDVASSSYQVNANTWVGSALENALAEYEVETYGTDCAWKSCRWEKQGSTPRVFFRDGAGAMVSTRNVLEDGFGVQNVAATVETGCINNVIRWAEGEQQLGSLSTRSKLGDYTYSFQNAPVLRRSGAGVALNGAFFVQGESFARLEAYNSGELKRGDGTAAPAVTLTHGVGNPEASVTGGIGSLDQRSNGAAGAAIYYKASGTGNTGWIPLGGTRFQTVATDADFTLTVLGEIEHVRHTGTLTADRTVTLSTTGVFTGARWRITRVGSGFNLSIGGLKNLVQNTWCEVLWDSGAWRLMAYGAL